MNKTIKYTEITKSEFLSQVSDSKCSFLKGINKKYFNKKFGFINTKDFIRPSKETKDNYHFYDEFLNECYSWNNFARRKHSIIGTTSFEVASLYSMYGEPGSSIYFVIPIDAETLMCPTDDILSSFKNHLTNALVKEDSISFLLELNIELKKYFEMKNFSEQEIRKLKYSDLVNELSSIENLTILNEFTILKRLLEMNGNVEENINKILEPGINNFSLYTESKLLRHKGNGREIFASGKVLLCAYNEMTKLGLNPLENE